MSSINWVIKEVANQMLEKSWMQRAIDQELIEPTKKSIAELLLNKFKGGQEGGTFLRRRNKKILEVVGLQRLDGKGIKIQLNCGEILNFTWTMVAEEIYANLHGEQLSIF